VTGPRKPLLIVWFAGGGGSTVGIKQATGDDANYALNHNATALDMHAVNHPNTVHLCEDARAQDPRTLDPGRPIDMFWASPDCRDFSRAKGGAPRSPRIRGLAWTVIPWAKLRRPRVIILENVPEFQEWGPVDRETGEPIPDRRGETFKRFVRRLRQCGYAVEYRELRAADYGAPTTRQRFFLIARCDGQPIVWPAPSHSKAGGAGLLPWRTAGNDVIDWSIPCPSIFDRKRPLVEATMSRIAKGIERYVIGAARPFIVPITHHGSVRVHSVDDPLRTVTTAHRGELAVVSPTLDRAYGRTAPASADAPLATISTRAHDGLVATFMEQANTDMVGHASTEPVSTIVGRGTTQRLIAAALSHAYSSNKTGSGGDPRDPSSTILAGGGHHCVIEVPLAQPFDDQRSELRAFLTKYYGNVTGQDLANPMHSATSRARFGLVTVEGVAYRIVDIGMRMLTPRELFLAQGFPPDFIIDRTPDGRPISKTDQTAMAGNAVPPPWAEALTRANLPWRCIPDLVREAA
jgi:DNA (cytosine-5)-methyltransferase 1